MSEDRLVEELRRRTAEIEALAELERRREQQRKEVELRTEQEGGL
jgi:serine phosphatase RsbU (regulator of sigma subunit)